MPAIRAAESFPMQHLTEINDSLKEVISILASQLDRGFNSPVQLNRR